MRTSKHGIRKRKNVMNDALEGLTTTTSECSEKRDLCSKSVCSSLPMVMAIEDFVDYFTDDPVTYGDPSEVIDVAKEILDCDHESEVLNHPVLRNYVASRGLMSKRAVDRELDNNFKVKGPRDSLDLLSNYHIDFTLQQWAKTFEDFHPCPFAMMDFYTNGRDVLGKVCLPDVIEGKESFNIGTEKIRRPSKVFGCVVNTDVYSGKGKHWVAVFVDCRTSPWTVEYFNSAGNPPPRPMIKWMERTKSDLIDYRRSIADPKSTEVDTILSTHVDHQESKTECGLYSLYYIRRRLEGTPPQFFMGKIIPDESMTAFRKHIFRHA